MWLLYVGALHAVFFGHRHLMLEGFKIPSSAMAPTLLVGDHFLVDHLDRDVQRGDVVLFRYPVNPDTLFIMRAVGIAGDRLQFRGAQLIVNGVPSPTAGERACAYVDVDEFTDDVFERPATCLEERIWGRTHTIMHSATSYARDVDVGVVPPGTIFVAGDNRENSHDSRFWGPVPLENVIGKPLYIWWSSPPAGEIPWHRLGRWIR